MKEVAMNLKPVTCTLFAILIWVGLLSPTTTSAQDYRMSLDVTPAAVSPGDLVTVRVLLQVFPGGPGFVTGSSFGVSHDPALYNLVNEAPGADLLVMPPCGLTPDFLAIVPHPIGFTLGVVHSLTTTACDFGPGCYELAVATYTSLAAQFTAESFSFDNSLGNPPVNTVVAVNLTGGGTVTFIPDMISGPPTNLTCTTSGGVITLSWTNNGDYPPLNVECNGAIIATVPPGTTSFSFTPATTGVITCKLVTQACSVLYQSDGCGVTIGGQTFVRCDCNRDGLTNIADAICLLTVLFIGGSFSCDDAADGNDDGIINIADVISCLTAQFLGGTTPAPSPGCGADPTLDTLRCARFPPCP